MRINCSCVHQQKIHFLGTNHQPRSRKCVNDICPKQTATCTTCKQPKQLVHADRSQEIQQPQTSDQKVDQRACAPRHAYPNQGHLGRWYQKSLGDGGRKIVKAGPRRVEATTSDVSFLFTDTSFDCEARSGGLGAVLLDKCGHLFNGLAASSPKTFVIPSWLRTRSKRLEN